MPHDMGIATASTTATEKLGVQVWTSGDEDDRVPDTL